MQYSNTTDKNGCIQYIESLCKLGDGGITGDTTLFKQITSYFNQADKKVSMALLRVDKNWKFDDVNYTDFPIATIDLVASQRDYTLPAATSGGNASTLWKIEKVEVLQTNGEYKEIRLMVDGEEESTSVTTPTAYNIIGGSIRFKELPLVSTGGLRITFQRSGVAFTTASTTQQPGYMDAYHDLPCYDAAASYLLPFNADLATRYSNIFESRLLKLESDWLGRVKTRDRLQGPVRNYE